jgi:tetratricopeptide (TPR) repeat protein
VLAEAKDLDEYVKTLDQEVQKEGQDSPLIRQKIGVVYAKRNEHPKAISQFQIAIQLDPTDAETQQQLIKSYDALGDQAGAIRQTLALLDVDRHNLELYKKLADRLANDEALSERAATTIVEAAPNEAEHHQALAEVRQKRNRWADAISQWKLVAQLRALEPGGLVNLAAAQIHEKQFSEAQESLDKLNRTEWPSRFSDLPRQIRELQEKIPKKR